MRPIQPTPAATAHVLVRNMAFLVLPVYHLGSREGQGPSAPPLDLFCKLVGDHVEPVIDLTVMMQIEEGRSVRQGLEDTPGHEETERDRIREGMRRMSSPKPRISLS